MELLSSASNVSNRSACIPDSIRACSIYLIIDSHHSMITHINYVFLCSIISAVGLSANVINLIIFYRQGLQTTINIGLFCLAIADFFSLFFQQISNIYVNPLFVALHLPIVYPEVQFLTARLVRMMFTRITFYITVYITAERCFCIAFPLHIKRIITPKRTVVTLVLIYLLTGATFLPSFSVTYLDWTFHAASNRMLLRLAFRKYKDIVIALSYFIQAISGTIAFITVVVLTLTLVHKLQEKSNWRQKSNLQHETAQTLIQRDRATVKMVVLIAAILILCYMPSVFLCLTTFIEPEFTEVGRYHNLYNSLWSIAMLMENINSSVNILFYFKMSSKYRQTLKELMSRCHLFEEQRNEEKQ